MHHFGLIALISFLLGAIPFGVLLARAFKLPDPRTLGSGNIGATNMLRTGSKKVALLTLLLDAGKGALAVWIAYRLFPLNTIIAEPFSAGCPPPGPCITHISFPPLEAFALSLAALGHMLSPWLKFKGGKGVATILGGALMFSPVVGAFACVIWLMTYLFFRYVSLASIIMLALLPVMVGLRVDGMSAAIIGFACAVALYKHRSNIHRLMQGVEPKTHLKRGQHG